MRDILCQALGKVSLDQRLFRVLAGTCAYRCEQARKFERVNRFRQVMIETRVPGAPTVFFLSPACQSHQDHGLTPWLLSNLVGHFVAI